jgi:hypothetical protein
VSRNLPLIALPLGLAGLLLLLFLAGIPQHEWRAWKLSEALATVPHPADTSLVVARRKVGLLVGNGNHCDFFAGELRSFTGTREQLQAFYTGKEVPSPLGSYPEEVRIAFFDSGKERPVDLPYDFAEPEKWGAPRSQADQFYVVYLFNGGHDTGMDIRCH